MESFVERETARQFKHLPPHLSRHLDPIDVATYALNRLPPLYASTEKGKAYQELSAESRLKTDIEKAVRQAISAVQRDPIRQIAPLTSRDGGEKTKAKEAFTKLQEWLHDRHLLGLDPVTADNLIDIVRAALRGILKPHLIALENLQTLLEKKYHLPLDEDITYENLVKVVEEAIEAGSDRV